MSDTTAAAASPAQIPPGWYDDGTGTGHMRWWSGAEWTEHVAAPVAATYAAAPVRPVLPAGTPIYSVWIWLVVLLPLVSYVSFLFWQPSFDYLGSNDALSNPARFQAEYQSLLTPGYFVSLFLGWVIYGLGVVFAWRDVVWLRKQGVVRPFHWAWTFLLSWVYIIGRSVIVYRVAAPRGRAPIWVLIGVVVVSFVVAIAWTVSIMSGMFSHLTDYSSTYSS